MKFELSDEALLLVAGAGNALFAAHAAAAPKHFHNTYMSEVGPAAPWLLPRRRRPHSTARRGDVTPGNRPHRYTCTGECFLSVFSGSPAFAKTGTNVRCK